MAGITAQDLVRAFAGVRNAIEAEKAELSRLDGVIGDADHGVGMALGFDAVSAALAANPPTEPAAVFNIAARSFLDSVGASTGPLYATAFMRAGAATKGEATLDRDAMVGALAAMVRGMTDRGKARAGEKTMVDAWMPAVAAAERVAREGCDLGACLDAAAAAAAEGAEATKHMPAAKGRASRLGERALGHMDPGAASAVVILRALAASLRPQKSSGNRGW